MLLLCLQTGVTSLGGALAPGGSPLLPFPFRQQIRARNGTRVAQGMDAAVGAQSAAHSGAMPRPAPPRPAPRHATPRCGSAEWRSGACELAPRTKAKTRRVTYDIWSQVTITHGLQSHITRR